MLHQLAYGCKLVDAFITGTDQSCPAVSESTLLHVCPEEANQWAIKQCQRTIMLVLFLLHLVLGILIDLADATLHAAIG